MTVDEVKAELKRVEKAKTARDLAKERASEYEGTLKGGKTVQYGGNGENREKRGNPVENAYCSLISLKDDAEQRKHEYNEVRRRAQELINLVSDPIQHEVLERRYIRFELWKDIADNMHYSKRRIYQIHSHALQKIALLSG